MKLFRLIFALPLLALGTTPAHAIRVAESGANPILALQQGDPATLTVQGWWLKARLLPGKAEVDQDVVVKSSLAQKVAFSVLASTGTWTVNGRPQAGGTIAATLSRPGTVRLHYHGTLPTSFEFSGRPGPGGWLFTVRRPASWGRPQRIPQGEVSVVADPAYRPDDPRDWKTNGNTWTLDLSQARLPVTRFVARVLSGTVQPIGMTIQMQGTHQLVGDNGDPVATLEAATPAVHLQDFVGRKVQVAGDLGTTVEGNQPFMKVRQVVPLP